MASPLTDPTVSVSQSSFDWSDLHTILEGLPASRCTTYGDLADVVGPPPSRPTSR